MKCRRTSHEQFQLQSMENWQRCVHSNVLDVSLESCLQENADLVTFIEDILNGELHIYGMFVLRIEVKMREMRLKFSQESVTVL